MKKTVTTQVYPAQTTNSARIIERRFGTGDDVYWFGTIPTFHGIVEFYRQRGIASHSTLRLVLHGLVHHREFNYALSDRFAVTASKRFAEEAAKKMDAILKDQTP